ncbi:MAG: hypothetical protein AAGD06_31635 [Acidobacteriota bacterium]
MNSAEQNLQYFRSALQSELKKHWGHISEIETRIEKSDGYLRKFCNGASGMSLEQFLRCLEALGVDAGEFTAQALGTVPSADLFLAALDDERRIDRGWKKLERAVHELSLVGPTTEPTSVSPERAAALAEKLLASTATEQRRRLRHTASYRDPEVASAYLDGLDQLRHHEPRLAIKLVVSMVVDFLPKLEADTRRLRLLCRALAVYESAQRLSGEFATAARALRVALGLSREQGFLDLTANLLMRGSYHFMGRRRPELGLHLLREAQEIYFDLDDAAGLAKVTVNRGVLTYNLDQFDKVKELMTRALGRLQVLEERSPRHELAAYQHLALAHQGQGQLDLAEHWLERASTEFETDEVVWAKLAWQRATLLAERRAFGESELLLRRSAEILGRQEHPIQTALVSLDLVDVLLSQQLHHEACLVAKDMAHMLELFRHHPLAEAAMVEFVRSAVDSTLSRELVQRAGEAVQKAHSRA